MMIIQAFLYIFLLLKLWYSIYDLHFGALSCLRLCTLKYLEIIYIFTKYLPPLIELLFIPIQFIVKVPMLVNDNVWEDLPCIQRHNGIPSTCIQRHNGMPSSMANTLTDACPRENVLFITPNGDAWDSIYQWAPLLSEIIHYATILTSLD